MGSLWVQADTCLVNHAPLSAGLSPPVCCSRCTTLKSLNWENRASLKKERLFDIWRVDKDSNSVYNFVIETLNLRNCKDDIKDLLKHNKVLDLADDRRRISKIQASNLKKRKVTSIIQDASPEQLVFATQISLRSTGSRDTAEIVKQVNLSPKRVTKIKKPFKSPETAQVIKLNPDQALAYYVDTKLARGQYIETNKIAKKQNANIYSCYDEIIESKKKCYSDDINITDMSAEINLQSLINHTILRLFQSEYEQFAEFLSADISSLNIIFKWRCDGASGQSTYKQKLFENIAGSLDGFLNIYYITSTTSLKNQEKALCKNPLSSLTRYCRPIKVIFDKETALLITREVEKIESQITNLHPSKFRIYDKEPLVEQSLVMTMVDGKICSILTEQSSQKCYICGSFPKEINILEKH
ncbi:hypothetical protein AVEN_191149-1 [Araneus ventricosus]|uniref:Uncharacterized protein n=1 Tax=Araneus ventricosus TaxID=182803 RepID=A0A4Y2B0T4_ARAVE|nr:hypothetical protein AVEN_191149-1 [Araneus ventricosus]